MAGTNVNDENKAMILFNLSIRGKTFSCPPRIGEREGHDVNGQPRYLTVTECIMRRRGGEEGYKITRFY